MMAGVLNMTKQFLGEIILILQSCIPLLKPAFVLLTFMNEKKMKDSGHVLLNLECLILDAMMSIMR